MSADLCNYWNSFNLFSNSVKLDKSFGDLISNTDAVMVYGYRHCYYSVVLKLLGAAGLETMSYEKVAPREGGFDRSQLEYTHTKPSRQMKAALVNIVAENYFMVKDASPGEKVSLTRIIFCIDTNFALEGEKIQKFEPANFASKTKKILTENGEVNSNDLYTNKELRRAYKLCTDPNLSEDLRAIAKKTFLFVKVSVQQTDAHNYVLRLEPLPNLSAMIRWEQYRECRKSGAENESPASRDPMPWRGQLRGFEERIRLLMG